MLSVKHKQCLPTLCRSLCLIFCLLSPRCLYAEHFSGSVKDNNGSPVPMASIFVEETQQGTSTNEEGKFRLQLPPGKYTCVFQCVGYTSVKQQINLPKKGLAMDILMPIKAYEIGAVIVNKNREDPAYAIMRQVIGIAPYYSNQVEQYKAEVYIKGTVKIEKISKVIQFMGGKEFRDGLKTIGNKAILLESLNEITFRAPNNFHHKVISTNSSIPIDDFKGLNTMNFVMINPYQQTFVNRDAFRNYKFTYEGYTEDNGLLINKIKLTPKIKNPLLVSGYIYILDRTWHIYSVDLAGDAKFGTYKITGNCYQIRPSVYLPATFNVEGTIDLMGNKMAMSYQLALKYTEVVLNTKIANPLSHSNNSVGENQKNADKNPAPLPRVRVKNQNASTSNAANMSKAQQKSIADSVKRAVKQEERMQKINILLEKEELSNREMNRLAKLMQDNNDATRNSLDLSSDYKVEVDSNSRKMNAASWDSLRPVELKADEVKSLQEKDSLMQAIAAADTLPKDTTVKQKVSRIGSAIGKFFGASFRFNDGKTRIGGTILDPTSISFNPVDGFRYGVSARLRHDFDSGQHLRMDAGAIWAFSRKTIMWNANAEYRYLPARRAKILLQSGIMNTDYNNHHNYNNSSALRMATLLTHNSYMRLYEQFYLTLRHEIDIDNGLVLHTWASFANKWKLRNHTNFSIFYPKSHYQDNAPVNELWTDNLPLHRTFTAELALVYTPEYYYRFRGKQKIMVRSAYPTFTLHYKKALPQVFGSTSNYDLLMLRVNQRISTGLMRQFSYNAALAVFLNNRKVDFADFYHFNINGFPIIYPADSDPAERYYKYATNRWGAAADVGYVSPLILLKYIPKFSETYCRENLKWHFNYSPHAGMYNELHYSISEILLMIEIGAFVGFQGLRFSVFGVDVRIDL